MEGGGAGACRGRQPLCFMALLDFFVVVNVGGLGIPWARPINSISCPFFFLVIFSLKTAGIYKFIIILS